MRFRPLIFATLMGLGTHPATADEMPVERLVATCLPCHAGKQEAAFGHHPEARRQGIERWLRERLMAYREGRRPATVMHQLAGGYTPTEIERIARHLAESRR